MAATLDVIDATGEALAVGRQDGTVSLSVDGLAREYLQVVFLTSEQARTVAAHLLLIAAEIESNPDGPTD